MIGLQKLWKIFFFSSKNSFRSRNIQIFVLPPSPLFLPVSHCLRAWSEINLKVYGVINCLNKNLIRHFVWYLEQKKSYDVETLAIDTVLNKGHFHGKIMQKICTKASPKPLFYLGKGPEKPLHVRNYFRNKIFGKGIIKNL